MATDDVVWGVSEWMEVCSGRETSACTHPSIQPPPPHHYPLRRPVQPEISPRYARRACAYVRRPVGVGDKRCGSCRRAQDPRAPHSALVVEFGRVCIEGVDVVVALAVDGWGCLTDGAEELSCPVLSSAVLSSVVLSSAVHSSAALRRATRAGARTGRMRSHPARQTPSGPHPQQQQRRTTARLVFPISGFRRPRGPSPSYLCAPHPPFPSHPSPSSLQRPREKKRNLTSSDFPP